MPAQEFGVFWSVVVFCDSGFNNVVIEEFGECSTFKRAF